MIDPTRTVVSGEDAKLYKVIRLSDYADAFDGELISADSNSGAFTWKDRADVEKTATLGPHMIRIIPKGR